MRVTSLVAVIFVVLGSPLWSQPDVEQCSTPGVGFGGEFGTPPMITDSLSVASQHVIADLQVSVDISHTFIGDLVVDVVSPMGTSVRLHSEQGSGDEDIRLTYSDDGVPHESDDFDFGCRMQPSGPGVLADFDSENVQGSWQLSLTDVYPMEDDGVLNSWCVESYASAPPAPPSPVVNLGCVAESSSDLIQVTWATVTAYDGFNVYVDGNLAATVPGNETFADVIQAGVGPFAICVEGLVTGAQPACLTCCTVQRSAVAELESCSEPELAINAGPHGDSLVFSEDQAIGDVTVRVQLAHTWIADIEMDVTSPAATTVRLHAQGGGEADDIDLIYADFGVDNGAAPYNYGCFMKPSGPGAMADFAGEATVGAWNLTITDVFPAEDNGTLHRWCVRTYSTSSGTPAPPVQGLSCSSGNAVPGTAELTWSNPVTYEAIRVSVNGVQEAELPGDATEYRTLVKPDGETLFIEVVGVGLGAAPSCPVSCEVVVALRYELFIRGDSNVDGTLDISDPVHLLGYLFGSPEDSPLVCHDAADGNDDEAINLADAIVVLGHLFAGDPPPPAPHGQCGLDPTNATDLTCQSYPPCVGFTDSSLVGHVLRRIAYGPTPTAIEDVLALGVEAYIDEQLDPASIDESGNLLLNTYLNSLNEQTVPSDLFRMQLIRGLYSERQLQEQMTDFWETHFSTYFWTSFIYFARTVQLGSAQAEIATTSIEWRENQAFRNNSLGNFEDLLLASATSPAMLIYLDNVSNIVGAPNENYARELVELHSLGVDNGYTQADVEELARCFTGWTVCKVAPADVDDPHAPCLAPNDPTGVWAFHFEPSQHDYGAKVIFAGNPLYELTIPARPVGSLDGVLDGFEVIAQLAQRPETAVFVSTKLIRKFVADDAPPGLVAECLATWNQTNADMGAVMGTILDSNEFLGQAYRWNKIRTPMESLLATTRMFEGQTDAWSVLVSLYALGHVPMDFFTPDGFPETGVDQLGTSKLLERLLFSKSLYDGSDPSFDLLSILNQGGVAPGDVDEIVDFFLELLFQGNFSPVDRQLAFDFLSTNELGVATPLDPLAPEYAERIGQFAAFLTGFPQFLKQ